MISKCRDIKGNGGGYFYAACNSALSLRRHMLYTSTDKHAMNEGSTGIKFKSCLVSYLTSAASFNCLPPFHSIDLQLKVSQSRNK